MNARGNNRLEDSMDFTAFQIISEFGVQCSLWSPGILKYAVSPFPIIPNYLYETEHKTRQNIVNNCSLNFTGKLSSAVWNNANISCVFIRNETLRSTQLQEEAARVGTLMAATGVTQVI
ncbi:hypothetical protein I4U23_021811 [Adineta vaga]|nr:hypothetical protein I4U23_021811 [Adineta vaga]